VRGIDRHLAESHARMDFAGCLRPQTTAAALDWRSHWHWHWRWYSGRRHGGVLGLRLVLRIRFAGWDHGDCEILGSRFHHLSDFDPVRWLDLPKLRGLVCGSFHLHRVQPLLLLPLQRLVGESRGLVPGLGFPKNVGFGPLRVGFGQVVFRVELVTALAEDSRQSSQTYYRTENPFGKRAL